MYLLDGLQRSAHAAREMEEERKRERERGGGPLRYTTYNAELFPY